MGRAVLCAPAGRHGRRRLRGGRVRRGRDLRRPAHARPRRRPARPDEAPVVGLAGAMLARSWPRTRPASSTSCIRPCPPALHRGVGRRGHHRRHRRFPVRDGLSSAPKGAVEALVRGLAAEEGRYGVRVNAVGPGMLTDGMAARLIASGDLSERGARGHPPQHPARRFGPPPTSPRRSASCLRTGPASSPARSSTSTAAGRYDEAVAAGRRHRARPGRDGVPLRRVRRGVVVDRALEDVALWDWLEALALPLAVGLRPLVLLHRHRLTSRQRPAAHPDRPWQRFVGDETSQVTCVPWSGPVHLQQPLGLAGARPHWSSVTRHDRGEASTLGDLTAESRTQERRRLRWAPRASTCCASYLAPWA